MTFSTSRQRGSGIESMPLERDDFVVSTAQSEEKEELLSSSMERKQYRGWWHQDGYSVLLLLLLYVLQGLPLGLAGSIPMILAGKDVDYHQQALFSFVFWPFSIKLLWAPIVDGAFFKRFGRRKTWLVPTQYAIGLVMCILSTRVDDILSAKSPDIWALTISFFILNFCAATQDIAVDGWALTMLSKRNVGLASTCNSVGQTAGYFLGYVVYMALESKDFCNKYLRNEPQETGLITLSGFMFFWSIVFVITTTFVMIFKSEKSEELKSKDSGERHAEHSGVVDTYKLLWRIAWLPAVFQYIVILLTCKVGFASESAVGLKLIEAGVHKESLALLAIPMTPLQILLPLLIAKYTAGPRPMDLFVRSIPFRLVCTALFALIVYWTPYFKQDDGTFPYLYFVVILAFYSLHQVALYSMFVSTMAFNAKISDPRIGGSYMTLLNTVANLGGNWPSTAALWFVENLTWNYCEGGSSGIEFCSKVTKEKCTSLGGVCVMSVDGYYIEVVVCVILGIFWLLWKRRAVQRLQNYKEDMWKCPP